MSFIFPLNPNQMATVYTLVDRLRGVGCLLKNHLSQRQSEIRDVPVVGFKESEQLSIRWALHGSGPNIHESYEPEVGRGNRLRVRQAGKPFYSLASDGRIPQ
jgi:hypothetical protein